MSSLLTAELPVDPFSRFEYELGGQKAYAAGFPSYAKSFSRDTLQAGILAGRADILAAQLDLSAEHQGIGYDPLTGEHPGKIHHEDPGAQLPGRVGFTTYNACDTTSLFLIGAEGLSHLDTDAFLAFVDKRRENLMRATSHLLSLVGLDHLYWDRTPEGSTGYTLRVPYWKDSILPRTDEKVEPVYPVVFSQAHFMAARALLSASRILKQPDLAREADEMFVVGIENFITPDHFVVYRDQEGELRQASSDELHALAYIPTQYSGILPLDAIRQRARILATPYGYMCTPPLVGDQLSDQYHGKKVWVFDQALIHYGATQHGLSDEAATAAGVHSFIGSGQELFGVGYDNGVPISLTPEGNPVQLWSVAASIYFDKSSPLSYDSWL